MTAARRKPQPQQPRTAPTVDPALALALALLAELVSLQRETNEHLAAIRQQGELSIPETSFGTEPKLIDASDLQNVKQAAGDYNVDDDTMRRWMKKKPTIAERVAGNDYVSRSRLAEWRRTQT